MLKNHARDKRDMTKNEVYKKSIVDEISLLSQYTRTHGHQWYGAAKKINFNTFQLS